MPVMAPIKNVEQHNTKDKYDVAKKNYPDDLTIPYGDVEDYVDTTITNAEIDELFNK